MRSVIASSTSDMEPGEPVEPASDTGAPVSTRLFRASAPSAGPCWSGGGAMDDESAVLDGAPGGSEGGGESDGAGPPASLGAGGPDAACRTRGAPSRPAAARCAPPGAASPPPASPPLHRGNADRARPCARRRSQHRARRSHRTLGRAHARRSRR
eukprot:scaffold131812_cov54-Phaeocystis_antarctica.AAC.2